LVGGVTNVSGQATLSPGDLLPGRLGFLEEVIWQPGSNYNWQIVDATGTAGTTTGWDAITINGSLTLAATPADPMRLNLWGLQLTNPVASGSIANFNPTAQYRWPIATAEKGIFGFNADAVVINSGGTNGTGGFTNELAGGSFSLQQSGTSLDILFTPAPIILNVLTGTMTQSEAGYPSLSSGAAIVKQGDGVIVLNARNQYTGTTTVSAGSILLEGIGSMANSSLVQIDAEASLDVSAIVGGYIVPAGQTLAGSGTVFGSITFGRGSTLAPGAASTASSPDLLPKHLSDPILESHAVPEPSAIELAVIASSLILISRLRRHAIVEASSNKLF
jgi:autotransporter-associated beta strand protein